jgi:long-chain fatty acid transport protein
MSLQGWGSVVRATSALGLLAIASAQANAGGLGVREQSVYGQGTSFAGVAAGGALSSMFWNPATMTQFPGMTIESGLSGIFPFAGHTPVAGAFVPALPGTNNVGEAAPVLAGYGSYQLNPNMWLGVSLNTPFGLSENFPDNWAGRNYATNGALLATYNAAPSIAYRINDWISVGVGAQIQYARANFSFGIPLGVPPIGSFVNLKGSGMGYGATAGVTLTPTPTTTIGVGWRSAINQKIEGELVSNTFLPFSTLGSINTTVKLPDIVSLGIRQRIDPQWTLMGTVEWTNWSRIGTSTILQPNGSPALILGQPHPVPFQWRDGWFFSGGAEYIWTERLTVRGGVGYEISPVTDQVRTPLVPDNNRVWASVGATWRLSKALHFDLAYTHVWVEDAPINLTTGNPSFINPFTYVGNVSGHADVLSLAMVYRLTPPEPAVKPIIAK